MSLTNDAALGMLRVSSLLAELDSDPAAIAVGLNASINIAIHWMRAIRALTPPIGGVSRPTKDKST
jgi:hypothetical protein